MTWRKVETNRTARVCQVASLLLILGMVLGMLTHEVIHSPSTATTQRASALVAAAP